MEININQTRKNNNYAPLEFIRFVNLRKTGSGVALSPVFASFDQTKPCLFIFRAKTETESSIPNSKLPNCDCFKFTSLFDLKLGPMSFGVA